MKERVGRDSSNRKVMNNDWLNAVKQEAEKTNKFLLKEFCQQLLDYLSQGKNNIHFGREKCIEFIGCCLEKEAPQICLHAIHGFEFLVSEEENCTKCSIQDKHDFILYIIDSFQNASPLIERECVNGIRIILNFIRSYNDILTVPILYDNTLLDPNEIEYFSSLLILVEYHTSLIDNLSESPDRMLQRIFVLELHDLMTSLLPRNIRFYQPFIDFVWKKYSPGVLSFLGSPIIDVRCVTIILKLVFFISPLYALRSVSETHIHRLTLCQTVNERMDLLIVLKELLNASTLISLIFPPWIINQSTIQEQVIDDSDLSLFRKILSIIIDCTSSDDRLLVNKAYQCLNHCLEQLFNFISQPKFHQDEQRHIYRTYLKYGCYVIGPPVNTDDFIAHMKNEQENDNNSNDDEKNLSLSSSSTTTERVMFYLHHLKLLLKTIKVMNVADFDDALLQFSSFISSEYTSKTSNSSASDIIVANADGIYAATIWVLWYGLHRHIQQLFGPINGNHITYSKTSFMSDIMNCGMMIYIDPEWMNNLYEQCHDNFDFMQYVPEQSKVILYQMFSEIRQFNIPAVNSIQICGLTEIRQAKCIGVYAVMLNISHALDFFQSEFQSSITNDNMINARLIETHQLVFSGLKVLFKLAVVTGHSNSACSVLQRVLQIIEHNFDIKINYTNDLLILKRQPQYHSNKITGKHKQYHLHYGDVMAISFILELIIKDIQICPSVMYKFILRCCIYLLMLEQICCSVTKDKTTLTDAERLETNENTFPSATNTSSLLQLAAIDKTGHINEKFCAPILQALSRRVDKLYNVATRLLDLDSLLEFLEQLRVLGVTQLTKEDNSFHHSSTDFFPINVIIDKLGEMSLDIITSLRPRYHVCKVWSFISQLFIQIATHKDIGIAKRSINHMHTHLRSYLSVRPEYKNFHMNEEFFKPFEHLICTEQCDSIVENQIFNSICELVEFNTNNIKSGWRSIFACLKTVRIEQKQQNVHATDENKFELRRMNASVEILAAFINCDNLNVISSAAIDCLSCLFRYLREPDPWTSEKNGSFDELSEQDSHSTDIRNKIEMIIPALNMLTKFMHIFIDCYSSPSSQYIFSTKKRSRYFESISFTYCTFINYSSDFLTHIALLNEDFFLNEFNKIDLQEQIMDFLQMFEKNLEKDIKYLSEDFDSIDKTHLLSVWSYMIEGLTDTIFSCPNRYIIKIIDHYFEILTKTSENVNYQFSIYLVVCVIIPLVQSFVCSTFLKKPSLR
ncbi:unnamed protein product, partial [Didymodactylos carnosus]